VQSELSDLKGPDKYPQIIIAALRARTPLQNF
jgi:hypothetical protein